MKEEKVARREACGRRRGEEKEGKKRPRTVLHCFSLFWLSKPRAEVPLVGDWTERMDGLFKGVRRGGKKKKEGREREGVVILIFFFVLLLFFFSPERIFGIVPQPQTDDLFCFLLL